MVLRSGLLNIWNISPLSKILKELNIWELDLFVSVKELFVILRLTGRHIHFMKTFLSSSSICNTHVTPMASEVALFVQRQA